MKLTLENVNIDNSANEKTCALSFSGAGNTLTLAGDNTLQSGSSQPGVMVKSSAALTIDGDGKLTAVGGASGAGIGGAKEGSAGSITIQDGEITATGGDSAAGIGGGESAMGGTITITGGTVTATGGIRGGPASAAVTTAGAARSSFAAEI